MTNSNGGAAVMSDTSLRSEEGIALSVPAASFNGTDCLRIELAGTYCSRKSAPVRSPTW